MKRRSETRRSASRRRCVRPADMYANRIRICARERATRHMLTYADVC
jgi:hypothetical protein